jgi:hypothetical protein
VLQRVHESGGLVDGNQRNKLAGMMHVDRDEIDVSVENLVKAGLLQPTTPPNVAIGPFGREFLRAVAG